MILLELDRLLFTLAIKDEIYPCGQTMSSCLFENAQTRASLKSAFDNLFKKYGRDFADDDEIDLLDLEIVKGGKHIGREKRRDFGSCFKKTSHELIGSTDDPSGKNEMSDPMEENYDDIFVRLTQKVQKAQAFPLPPLRRSHASPTVTLSPDLRITPIKTKLLENNISTISLKDNSKNMESPRNRSKPKKASFNDMLLELIEAEEAELDKIADNVCDKLCKCESPKCFECSLINACLS
jgi:hypothetical protein